MANDDLIKGHARGVRNQPLASHHDAARFDCGVDSLNTYLRRHALTAPQHGLSRTWVTVAEDGTVLAYYTLGLATVTKQEATSRVSKGLGNYNIPCVLLARLAVDKTVQGEGLGSMALEDAMRKAVSLGRIDPASESVTLPLRAMLVHALNADAARFYSYHGFEVSPTDPLHLFILIKDSEKYFSGF